MFQVSINEKQVKEMIREVIQEELGKINFSTEVPQYLKGIEELAKFLGVGRSTAQKMKNEKVIPYVQYDRIVLFDTKKVMESLERQTRS